MFIAFEVALEMVQALRAPLEEIAHRDVDLSGQIRRAGASVPLNLAEGNRRVGKDRRHHWRVAAGSADEVVAGLRVAEVWGYLDRELTAEPRQLCDRVLAMIWRLTH